MIALAPLAVGLSACLLFVVQPLVGRAILPWFGGTAAVWTTCLAFFQSALVVGYAYAHGLGRLRSIRVQVAVHATLLVGVAGLGGVLPAAAWAPAADAPPVVRILSMLTIYVGPPYALLAATAPLVQVWWARARLDRSPYPLYAVSNAGAMLAIVAYPLVVEPRWGVAAQGAAFATAFGVFALAATATGIAAARRAGPALAVGAAPPVTWAERLVWMSLSGSAAALLLGVSQAMSQDVGAVPLLWVAPLGLYLLTFVVCFSRPALASRAVFGWLVAFAGPLLAWLLWRAHHSSLGVQLFGYGAVLLIGSMACHGELVRRRPAEARLTDFYLSMSLGGALGGGLVAVLGPLLLPDWFELHLAWLAVGGLWLLTRPRAAEPAWQPRSVIIVRRLTIAVAALVTIVGLGAHVVRRLSGVEVLERGFYGVLQVEHYARHRPSRHIVHLLDGRISHGFQYVESENRRAPTAYFVPDSGVGIALRHGEGRSRHVGVLGLGAGTLAAYGRPGDRYRFYEINPDVVGVARTHFTWLEDSLAEIAIVPGDGRLSLAREAAQRFDVLVLDAFAGDAIPVHLLTREAFALYARHLVEDGVLAVNISNRHVDVMSVVRVHGAALGMTPVWVKASSASPLGPYVSHWMLLSRNPEFLKWPALVARSRPLPSLPLTANDWAWTDDFAPLLPVLH